MRLRAALAFALVALLARRAAKEIAALSEHTDFTTQQYAVAIAYALLLATWAALEVHARDKDKNATQYDSLTYSDAENQKNSSETDEIQQVGKTQDPSQTQPKMLGIPTSALPAIRAAGEFVLIMTYVYLCDRTTLVPKSKKHQSKTDFWLLCLGILLVGLCTLRSSGESAPKPLQRDQTEEWKGWMQLMFILYHYFNETEIYNAIRIYIAAYVWMTGFGNFSYYYIKQDFSLPRFAQMMWRLNFFVFFVCATMNNEYMLYYICPMHTFFTWLVFFSCYAFNQYNTHNVICLVKIALTLLVAILLYDVKGVFHTVFAPFGSLFEFHDPLHPEFTDALHEWYFRSSLDHLVWVFGMLCAYMFPWFDRHLQSMDEMRTSSRIPAKLAVTGCTLALGGWWATRFFSLHKYDYNKVHFYTSWIPILCWCILRNMSPTLRRWHMHLFAFCGKVTLETYILQFHIWMKSTGLNGSPKYIMVWIPGWYWLNFAVISAVYLFISYRVFKITVVLRDACVPRDTPGVLRSGTFGIVLVGVFYLAGAMTKSYYS